MALEDVMRLLVQEIGGSYESFVQGSGTAQLPPDLKGGYCVGASITWLGMHRTGQSLHSALRKNPKAVQNYMSQIQRVAQTVGRGMSQVQPTIAAHLETSLTNAGFRKGGTSFPAFPFDSMARYISNNGHGGFYLIIVPGHAMAGYADSNGLRMFDPEAGEARFLSPDASELFICRYMCHKEVMESYNFNVLANVRNSKNTINEENLGIAVYRLFG